MNPLISFFFVAASLVIFFWYVNPTYGTIQKLRAEQSQFDEALNKSKELQAVRDTLLSKYNKFSAADVARLEKLLPDGVDNVKLVLDIDNIASRYGLRIRNVTVESGTQKDQRIIAPDTGPTGSVLLSFTIAASYATFVQFLKDLEQSLRLTDINSVSFTTNAGDLTEYRVSLKTYWLK